MRYPAVVLVLLAMGWSGAAEPAYPGPGTALRDYVEQADDTYTFEVVRNQTLQGARRYVVRLQSQTWQDKAWQHWMTLVVPDQIDHAGKAVMLVGGGSAESGPPSAASMEANAVVAAARSARVPVAVLQQVPNQPLFGGMYEDAAIAHTFERYLHVGGDWPLLLPMVKAVARAMDTVEQVLADEYELDVDGYVVAGASKRGWTTWLTAAVDERVEAIAPMVIDVLNFAPQMRQQAATYGGASPMIRDYTERGLIEALDTEVGQALVDLVDPFAYRESLDLPKLIVLGTNDPYWTVDSANLYVHELEGPTHLAYVPNVGHAVSMSAAPTMLAFVERVFTGRPMPELHFEQADAAAEADVTLRVAWDEPAKEATLWEARSPNRDFRQAQWRARPIEVAGRQAEVTLSTPDDGWVAAFVQVEFGDSRRFTLSTPMTVLPDHFPFDEP